MSNEWSLIEQMSYINTMLQIYNNTTYTTLQVMALQFAINAMMQIARKLYNNGVQKQKKILLLLTWHYT